MKSVNSGKFVPDYLMASIPAGAKIVIRFGREWAIIDTGTERVLAGATEHWTVCHRLSCAPAVHAPREVYASVKKLATSKD